MAEHQMGAPIFGSKREGDHNNGPDKGPELKHNPRGRRHSRPGHIIDKGEQKEQEG